MNSPNANRSRPWPLWLCALVFVIVAGILALTLALFGVASTRWSSPRFLWFVLVLILPMFFHFIHRKKLPRFSLVTIFFVTGLIASGIALSKVGPPWKEVHRFPGHEVNIAMSADGKLVAASQGSSIEIRETQTGRSVQTIEMSPTEAKTKANQRRAFKIAFANEGQSLMTVGWQTYPCLFDVATGKEQRKWPANPWRKSELAAQGTRFMVDSAAPASTLRQCHVYDVEQDQPILKVETKQHFFRSISPTGSHVLIGKDETNKPGLPSSAELWAVDEQRLLGTIPLPQDPLIFAKFSSDGKLLAVPTSTGLAIWDVSQCRQLSQWKPANFDSIRSMGWSPDGSRLAASYIEMIGPSGPVAAAAAMAGKSKRNAIEHYYLLDQQCQEISAIQGASATFSPSGDRIATVFGNPRILDGETGDFLAYLPSQARASFLGVPAFFFSPDGVWLFHSGSPTVYQKTRSERWYSVYELPAFWGVVLFLSALIVQIAKSTRLPELLLASPTQQ